MTNTIKKHEDINLHISKPFALTALMLILTVYIITSLYYFSEIMETAKIIIPSWVILGFAIPIIIVVAVMLISPLFIYEYFGED